MSIKAVLEKLATYTGGVLNASDVIVFAESHPKSALHSQFDWCTTRAQWPSPSPHQGSADEAASRRGGRGQSMTQVASSSCRRRTSCRLTPRNPPAVKVSAIFG